VGAHIGALVVEEFSIDPENFSSGIDCGTYAVALLARMICREKVLAPVFDPFDWSAESQCCDAD